MAQQLDAWLQRARKTYCFLHMSEHDVMLDVVGSRERPAPRPGQWDPMDSGDDLPSPLQPPSVQQHCKARPCFKPPVKEEDLKAYPWLKQEHWHLTSRDFPCPGGKWKQRAKVLQKLFPQLFCDKDSDGIRQMLSSNSNLAPSCIATSRPSRAEADKARERVSTYFRTHHDCRDTTLTWPRSAVWRKGGVYQKCSAAPVPVALHCHNHPVPVGREDEFEGEDLLQDFRGYMRRLLGTVPAQFKKNSTRTPRLRMLRSLSEYAAQHLTKEDQEHWRDALQVVPKKRKGKGSSCEML